MFGGVYGGRRVLVTGHTGFKGSWLTTWLLDLGAEVAGFSVDVPTEPSNFEVLGLRDRVQHFQGDIRDCSAVQGLFDAFQPEVVFHLAAQSLVRRSYCDPVRTFATNTLGTIHVLEVLRGRHDVRAGVIITSDKAYRNVEWPWGYREDDKLGGEDPYSGSKGCAELAFYSYYHSFFANRDDLARLATARAGNVIGGGDWAEDRVLPDCVRSWSIGDPVVLRNPNATRPWQHVLEPLSGYLWLGARLYDGDEGPVGGAYNFGPQPGVDEPVSRLVEAMAQHWPAATWEVAPPEFSHRREAILLKLACDKALHELGWKAVLSFEETVALTAEWYRTHYSSNVRKMFEFAGDQIHGYTRKAQERGLKWAAT